MEQPGFERRGAVVGLEVMVAELADPDVAVDADPALEVAAPVDRTVEAVAEAVAEAPRTFPTLEQNPLSSAIAV